MIVLIHKNLLKSKTLRLIFNTKLNLQIKNILKTWSQGDGEAVKVKGEVSDGVERGRERSRRPSWEGAGAGGFP